MEVGVQGKNNLPLLSVNNFYPEPGETLYKALPAYQALTGCDYTASFFKIGKVPPSKFLEEGVEEEGVEEGVEAQIVLSELSTIEEEDENAKSTIESYLCKMYASENICKASDLRTHTSEEIWKNKTRRPFELCKNCS